MYYIVKDTMSEAYDEPLEDITPSPNVFHRDIVCRAAGILSIGITSPLANRLYVDSALAGSVAGQPTPTQELLDWTGNTIRWAQAAAAAGDVAFRGVAFETKASQIKPRRYEEQLGTSFAVKHLGPEIGDVGVSRRLRVEARYGERLAHTVLHGERQLRCSNRYGGIWLYVSPTAPPVVLEASAFTDTDKARNTDHSVTTLSVSYADIGKLGTAKVVPILYLEEERNTGLPTLTTTVLPGTDKTPATRWWHHIDKKPARVNDPYHAAGALAVLRWANRHPSSA